MHNMYHAYVWRGIPKYILKKIVGIYVYLHTRKIIRDE